MRVCTRCGRPIWSRDPLEHAECEATCGDCGALSEDDQGCCNGSCPCHHGNHSPLTWEEYVTARRIGDLK